MKHLLTFCLKVVNMEDHLCHFRVLVLTSWPVRVLTSTRCSVMVSTSQNECLMCRAWFQNFQKCNYLLVWVYTSNFCTLKFLVPQWTRDDTAESEEGSWQTWLNITRIELEHFSSSVNMISAWVMWDFHQQWWFFNNEDNSHATSWCHQPMSFVFIVLIESSRNYKIKILLISYWS